ncbi:cytochrome P450 2D14 [Ornithorhynchus anatinus]|uniref:Cytochrome P450 n=1 Tax=Ornithorhynchus anatinus TaxID=9258 RepID=F7BJZ9_ORNAN|nr:cytochrome P450 2D14 [Ornithorhynchus anatinus]
MGLGPGRRSQLLSWDNLAQLGIFLVVFLLLLDFQKRRKRWRGYPPGPSSLPFVGNLLQIDFHQPHLCFDRLREKFGDVFSLQFSWTNVVVLNGLAAVKEALVQRSEETAGRPPLVTYDHLGFGPNSEGLVLAQYGQAWKEQRRFSLSTMRNFGLGKKSLEQWVTEEASFLCSAFSSEEGRPFNPHFLLRGAVSNVISSLTFGDRLEYDDQTLQKLLDLLDQSLKEEEGILPQILNAVPWLVTIPGLPQRIFRAQKAFITLLDTFIEEHKKTRDPALPRDLTDAYLEQVDQAKDDPGSSFNDRNIRIVVTDLFTAGTETTSTTLKWALLFMLLHPDVQSRVQVEIDQVIGRDRRPTMADQAKMPFTNAVIHECQRLGDIIPIGLPHLTLRDTQVQGFFIPEGTYLILNLSSVLKDDTVWEKPHQFYPEHFLDRDGRFVKPEAFLPFSAGRRVCLGEPLARMELFLFFTCLLQRFTFRLPEDRPRPSLRGHFALTLVPQPYQLQALLR